MLKNLICGLVVCWCVGGDVTGMNGNVKNNKSFFYRVPEQLRDLRSSNENEIDVRYDKDSDWSNIKDKSEDELENIIERDDLDERSINNLSSESNYNEKPKAFEQAFFGNRFLYNKFCALVTKARDEDIKDLANMHSEFFRWIIENQRGEYEKAKSLVALYKSLGDYDMYVLWKCIAVFLNLPVERI